MTTRMLKLLSTKEEYLPCLASAFLVRYYEVSYDETYGQTIGGRTNGHYQEATNASHLAHDKKVTACLLKIVFHSADCFPCPRIR